MGKNGARDKQRHTGKFVIFPCWSMRKFFHFLFMINQKQFLLAYLFPLHSVSFISFLHFPHTPVRRLPHILYRCSTLSPPTQVMLECRRCVLPFDGICINLELLELDKSIELTIIAYYEYYLHYFHRHRSNLRCKSSI